MGVASEVAGTGLLPIERVENDFAQPLCFVHRRTIAFWVRIRLIGSPKNRRANRPAGRDRKKAAKNQRTGTPEFRL